jgi:DNA-binding NarL/FixJ family response regulator
VYARDDARSSSGKSLHGNVRVLLVEDDFLVARDVELALEDAGLEVTGIAASAEEAIELATTTPPTLIVMDIRLAGQRDGIDAALELFRAQRVRCIFATAHHDRATRARAEPASPLGWLQKPYSMASLVEMIRRSLNDLEGSAG